MIKEEKDLKDLLLKDLCARLPYRTKCKYYNVCSGEYEEGTIKGFEREEYIQVDGTCVNIENIKPYLFPLSSMTEEQLEEFEKCGLEGYHDYDWYNKNHFDYRGLIKKGLAIDATGLNVYKEE